MTNFTKISPSYSGAEIPENSSTNNSVYDTEWSVETDLFLYTFVFVICVFGLVGNGIVVWLLGFHMKRHASAIYILNLAVADFGVLMSVVLFCLLEFHPPIPEPVLYTALCLFTFTSCTSQLLLTVTSIDRCVSVFFPPWHPCLRPSRLSAAVCALIWLLNFLLCGIQILFQALQGSEIYLLLHQIFTNVVLCFPLITISTLTLLFKVCCKPKQLKRGKLLTVILLILLVFLIVAFPFSVVILYCYFSSSLFDYLYHYGFLCAAVNSGINPLIYFLVGRRKRENIKAIFQRLFKEEVEFLEEPVHGSETIM